MGACKLKAGALRPAGSTGARCTGWPGLLRGPCTGCRRQLAPPHTVQEHPGKDRQIFMQSASTCTAGAGLQALHRGRGQSDAIAVARQLMRCCGLQSSRVKSEGLADLAPVVIGCNTLVHSFDTCMSCKTAIATQVAAAAQLPPAEHTTPPPEAISCPPPGGQLRTVHCRKHAQGRALEEGIAVVLAVYEGCLERLRGAGCARPASGIAADSCLFRLGRGH